MMQHILRRRRRDISPGGGSEPDYTEQIAYLTENARAFWNFDDNGNDLTGNGYNLVGTTGSFVQIPDYRTFKRYNGKEFKGAYVDSGKVPLLPGGHATLLQQDHELHISLAAGRVFNVGYLFGVNVSSQVYNVRFINTGQIEFQIRSRSVATTLCRTNGSYFPGTGVDERRAYGQMYIRIRVDYGNSLLIFVNGGRAVTPIVSGDAPSIWVPNLYPGTHPIAIGASNINNGETGFNSGYFRLVNKVAVTEILSNEDAEFLRPYFMS